MPLSAKELTYEQRIERALDGNGQYTHNIIGIVLHQVLEKEGQAEVNALIDEYGLDTMGFKKRSV